MPAYRDLQQQRRGMPSLADLIAAIRAKREGGLRGERPDDATGGPVAVTMPDGEAIRAQPVSGQGASVTVGQPQIAPQVSMGMPQRQMTMPPMMMQAGGGGAPPAMASGPGAMDPRAARIRALMSQGMSYRDAMMRVQQGG